MTGIPGKPRSEPTDWRATSRPGVVGIRPRPTSRRTVNGGAVHGPGRLSHQESGSSSIALWSALPNELARVYRPHIDRIAREVLAEVKRAVPEYTTELNPCVEKYLVEAVQEAIQYSIDSIGGSTAPRGPWAEIFIQRGRIEYREGRTMDALQTAYRVGGRAAWRVISEIAQSMGIPAKMTSIAAEAIFAFVNDLSTLSLHGYAAEQARTAGTRERRRRRLVELILAQPSISSPALSDLAEAAQWTIPEQVTVIALERGDSVSDNEFPEFADDVLVDLEGSQPCIIAADPDQVLGDRTLSELRGWRVAVGPSVDFSDAPASLRWARRIRKMVRRGLVADEPVLWCRDHLSTLWLLSDRVLSAELSRHALQPMDNLTPNQRNRLSETLLAWLETRGGAPEIARTLEVHPQTVRYRMHQLEALFGDRLANPRDRFDLQVALSAQRLNRPAQEADPEN
jgi:hypothetical protein